MKKWKTASNIIFKHGNIIEHVPDALRRKISAEFHDLSSDSILKGISPEEITAFNNGILVKVSNALYGIQLSMVLVVCYFIKAMRNARELLM